MSNPIFGSWVTVTEDVAGRKMREQGLVTEVFVETEESGLVSRVRVVFEDEPEGVMIPISSVTTDMKWLPPKEAEAIDRVTDLLYRAYASQRPKRDRIAREIYDLMAEIFES